MAGDAPETPWRGCDGCTVTIPKAIILTESREDMLQFLFDHSVIPRRKTCPECRQDMTLTLNQNMFNCYKRQYVMNGRRRVSIKCRKRVSLFKGTWFGRSKLALEKNFMFVAYWAILPPPRHTLLTTELEITKNTVTDWTSLLRDVCYQYFCQQRRPIGGPGSIIEIDEARIRSGKYDLGCKIEGTWVFSGIDRNSKECFLVPVPKKGSDGLLTVIREYVRPGTTVMSNCWRTYDCLQDEGFQHLTVNHSYNFVDPETGAHMQTINRNWREVRLKIPPYGNTNHHGYLAEFLFKRKYGDYKTRVHHLWRMIADTYNGEDIYVVKYNDSGSSHDESDN